MLWFNYKLHKIGLVDAPICTYCKTHNENRYHIFCECDVVKIFWTSFCTWLENVTGVKIKLCNKTIILGHKPACIHDKQVLLLKSLLLLAKQYICYRRFLMKLD
jgi:hypothetical protein